jgi:hypothetical protein
MAVKATVDDNVSNSSMTAEVGVFTVLDRSRFGSLSNKPVSKNKHRVSTI